MTTIPTGLARRFASFGALPLLASFMPLLVLPIISRSVGQAGWGSLMAGQAVGIAGAAVVMWGWGVVGQSTLGQVPQDQQAVFYRTSFMSRLRVCGAVMPVAVVLTVLTVPSMPISAALMCAAGCLTGLSPAWFAVGIGRAGWIAWYEVLPKAVATGTAAAALLWGGASVAVYPVLLAVFTIGGILWMHRVEFGSWKLSGIARSSEGAGAKAAAVSLTAATYASAPLPVASVLLTASEVSSLASIDRLFRYSMFIISSAANALQHWVVGSAGAAKDRIVSAYVIHAAIGVAGCLGLGLLGPFTTSLLFGSQVAASPATAWGYGFAFLALNISTPVIRNLLVPQGRVGVVLAATTVGAVVGITTMFAAAAYLGPAGISFGLAASESAGALIVVVAARSANGAR